MFKAYGFRQESDTLFPPQKKNERGKKKNGLEMNSPAGDEVTDHRSGTSSSCPFDVWQYRNKK